MTEGTKHVVEWESHHFESLSRLALGNGFAHAAEGDERMHFVGLIRGVGIADAELVELAADATDLLGELSAS